jgi:ABC-type arginine/histidine transport system permease subunit
MDGLKVFKLCRTAEEESLAAFILEAAIYNALRVCIQHVRVPVLVGPKQFRTQRAGACYTTMFRVRPLNVRIYLVYYVICQLAIDHGAEPHRV